MNDRDRQAWIPQSTTQVHRVRDENLEQLITRARERSAAAVGELRVRFGIDLETKIGRLGSLAREHAGDVVNDVFLALPDRLQGYAEDGRFEQWLYRQAFNRWRTIRRTLRADRHESSDLASFTGRALSAPIRIDLDLLRERALQLLTESEREVWLLAVEGFPPREIGEMLGITPNAASVRLDRAKRRLTALAKEYR
jgi:RNA polymerase sigma factor (sigma-70 family)